VTTTSIGDPLVGVLLDGRYQILQRLARGGMATVYRATDMRLGRVVAVKVMHDGLGEDDDFIRKFDREARLAAKLSHPNVVAVFDQGHDAGRPYIVMELVQGCTLRNVISTDTPMEPLRALELIDLILAALCAAHENGLVHRDIKPENVLISDRGQLKVADFGLARAVSAHTTATQGVLIGTVSYLPPELVLHGKADSRSDVYAAGVVLFELLTGTKPYTGETPIQVAYAHVHNQIPPPSTRLDTHWQVSRNGIPPYLDALVLSATQREPDLRPTDAREFRAMVRRAIDALSHGIMDDPALTAQFTSRAFADRSAHPEGVEESGTAQQISPQSPPTVPQPVVGGSAPEPERPRKRRESHPRVRRPATAPSPVALRRRRLVTLVMLIVVTVTGAGAWWMLDGRYVTTPTLTGLSQADAVRAADEQGLVLESAQDFSESVPAGVVISTEPAAGTDVLRGGTVAMTVSRGPERFAMPRVIGLSKDDAEKVLVEKNLAVGTVKEDWHEEIAAGLVSETSAESGTPMRRDARIDLTLSKGPRPIQIANQTGRPAAEAQSALESAGFHVVVKTAHSTSVPVGNVISQDPAGGTGHRGRTVTIVRSLGPAMVKVPDVRALPVKDATDQLTRAGFKVETQKSEDSLDIGYVQRTDPEGGQEALQGSTITLFVI